MGYLFFLFHNTLIKTDTFPWKLVSYLLDSVGSDGLSADIKKLVEKTCHADTTKAVNIDGMVGKIMSDAIKSVSSHDLIYPGQLPSHQSVSTAVFQIVCARSSPV